MKDALTIDQSIKFDLTKQNFIDLGLLHRKVNCKSFLKVEQREKTVDISQTHEQHLSSLRQ